jgi:hypothetical protein
MHHGSGVRRVRDDAIGRAVLVESKRILAGANLAGIDTAQAEILEMPYQRAVASTGLGKAADSAKMRINGNTAARGVG